VQVKSFILHADRWIHQAEQPDDAGQAVVDSPDVSGHDSAADGSMGAAGEGTAVGSGEGGGGEARGRGGRGGLGGAQLPVMDLVRLEDLYGNIFWDIEMNVLSSQVADQFSTVSMVCVCVRVCVCVCACVRALQGVCVWEKRVRYRLLFFFLSLNRLRLFVCQSWYSV